MPDEDELLEVLADYLKKKGFTGVENQCGILQYKRDGKAGSIYIDVMESEDGEGED